MNEGEGRSAGQGEEEQMARHRDGGPGRVRGQGEGGDGRDSAVETAIVLYMAAALVADPPTELTVIDVESEDGIVTLRGQMAEGELHSAAAEMASELPGVREAINDMENTAPEEKGAQ
jgi:osmotically-inducible protein OsmY